MAKKSNPPRGPIDHVAEALLWGQNAVTAQASHAPKNEELAIAYATIAQMHATLALVAVQRDAITALTTTTGLDIGSQP